MGPTETLSAFKFLTPKIGTAEVAACSEVIRFCGGDRFLRCSPPAIPRDFPDPVDGSESSFSK